MSLVLVGYPQHITRRIKRHTAEFATDVRFYVTKLSIAHIDRVISVCYCCFSFNVFQHNRVRAIRYGNFNSECRHETESRAYGIYLYRVLHKIKRRHRTMRFVNANGAAPKNLIDVLEIR